MLEQSALLDLVPDAAKQAYVLCSSAGHPCQPCTTLLLSLNCWWIWLCELLLCALHHSLQCKGYSVGSW